MLRALLHAAVILTAACSGGAGRADTSRQDTSRQGTSRGDSLAKVDDGCVRGEPEPALTVSGSATRPSFERRGKLEAIEDVQVDDSTFLRITHTGCAHYVQRFEFTVRGVTRDTADVRFWLEQAARYLEALPSVESMRPQLTSMATALRSAAGSSPPYVYENGIQASELAQVFLSVRNAGKGTAVVEVVFDYSL